jgi:hypothetical protein
MDGLARPQAPVEEVGPGPQEEALLQPEGEGGAGPSGGGLIGSQGSLGNQGGTSPFNRVEPD